MLLFPTPEYLILRLRNHMIYRQHRNALGSS